MMYDYVQYDYDWDFIEMYTIRFQWKVLRGRFVQSFCQTSAFKASFAKTDKKLY